MENRISGHKTEYDLIRLIAIILVLYNHSSDPGFRYFTVFFDTDLLTVTSWKFWPTLFVSIFCKIAVPLFFMISGALLLGKEESYVHVFKYRIMKYIVVLLVFSAFYFLIEQRFLTNGWLSFFRTVYSEGMITPFWFLYAYISFLLILPLLRKFVKSMDRKEYGYIFILVFTFQCIIPMINYFFFSDSVSKNSSLSISTLTGNIFLYPVLGYGLSIHRLNRRQKTVLAAAAMIVTILVMVMTMNKMVMTGSKDEDTFSTYFSCCCLIQTISFFSCACSAAEKRFFSSPGATEVLKKMAGCVFGIYLIHMAIMNKGWVCYYIMAEVLPSYLSLWIYLFIVFFLSMFVVFLLKRVPGIKKLL